jgi:hypothetical protein
VLDLIDIEGAALVDVGMLFLVSVVAVLDAEASTSFGKGETRVAPDYATQQHQ